MSIHDEATEAVLEELLAWIHEEELPDDFEIDLRKIAPRPDEFPENATLTVAQVRARVMNVRYSLALGDLLKPVHAPTFPVCVECGEGWPCSAERDRERREWNFHNPYALHHDLGCPAGSRDGFGTPGGPCACPARGEQEEALAVEAVGRFLRGGEDWFRANVRWRKAQEETR